MHTITINLDWFVYMYFLIEYFFHAVCMDLKMKHYYLENGLIPIETESNTEEETIYLEETYNLNIQEDDWEEVMCPTNIYHITPTVSELDDRTIEYLTNLTKEINSEELCDVQSQLLEEELNLADLNATSSREFRIKQVNSVTEVLVDEIPTTKIADNLQGKQRWLVSVLGMEEDYIHVSDGKRVWINIGERVHQINRKDSLSLEIVREGKNIRVSKIEILEHAVSSDYIIPDEKIEYEAAAI
ncbi:hypothetical protein [Niallia sp. MER TA 168]|uniref:hypothetical protein n=1 Tax=Niallia sp. MER TA 168 TaxID=2939568 RepID=UPI00203AB06E|nr:hypothetical protein [Niallia sp. MER TA 168]MCM3362024.1 hypothetical protein [Niallia sp. MER TA 168]